MRVPHTLIRRRRVLLALAVGAIPLSIGSTASAQPAFSLVGSGAVTDLALDVNTVTGDVSMVAQAPMGLTLYNIVDASKSLIKTNALLISKTNTTWQAIKNSASILAEGPSAGVYNKSDPTTWDTISLSAGQSIDLGDIFNVGTDHQDLTLEFAEPNATTGDPTTGDVYDNAQVVYNGVPPTPGNFYWENGTGNGNWSNGSAWSATSPTGTDAAGAPNASGTVYITNSDALSRIITLDVNSTIQSLQIGNTGGGVDTLSQTGTFSLSMQSEQVGAAVGSVGQHIQSAGTNSYSSALIVGSGRGSAGTYSLSGTGGINVAGAGSSTLGMYVGYAGNGNFNQSAGSVAVGIGTTSNLYLGYTSSGVGTYLLSGGTLAVNGSVYVGGSSSVAAGVGTLAISGGSMSVTNGLTVYSGSTLTQTGGTLSIGAANINTPSAFVVGNGAATATLNLTGGSTGASYSFANGLTISQGATLTGGGTIANATSTAPVTISGTVIPTAAQNSLAIAGSLTLGPSSTTLIQRIGSTPSFGSITSTGNMTLGGVLSLYEDAANEAITGAGQSFVILSTMSGILTGGFSDITSGQRLTTTDGSASFLVTVNEGVEGDVVLSGFELIGDLDYWKNADTTGNWSNGNNWSGISPSGTDNSGPPDANARVFITHTDGLSRVVTLDVNAAIQTLSIGNTGGGTDTLSQTAAFNLSMNTEQVGTGAGGAGVHNQSAGTNTYASALIVGSAASSIGTYSLSGTGSVNITAAGSGPLGMYVGYNGSGSFNQSAGSISVGSTSNANLYLGYNSSGIGSYALSGTGSLTVDGSVYVGGSNTGAGGVGTLAISGGSVSVSNGLTVYSGSTVTQSGGTVTAAQLTVNPGGAYTQSNGTLNIASASVNSTSAFAVGAGTNQATLNLTGSSYGATYTFASGLSIAANSSLTGGGTITNASTSVPVTVYGNITPTAAQNSLQINGTLTLEPSSTFTTQRVGSTPSFGSIAASGTISLGGALDIYEDAANVAETTSSQSFVILSTSGTLGGSFSDIASGSRLEMTNNLGSFLVTINPGSDGDVALSDFTAAPPIYYWKNSVTAGNWSNGNNWSGVSASGTDNAGAPPMSMANPTSVVEIINNDQANRVVTLDQGAQIQWLQISNTGGGTNTLNEAVASDYVDADIEEIGVGTGGTGVHNQSAGSNEYYGSLTIGDDSNSAGTYNLSGNAGIEVTGGSNSTHGLYVGGNGNGTFTASGGYIEMLGGAGSLSSNGIYVGYNGNGTFTGNGVSIGVEGGAGDSNGIYVGYNGNGTFNGNDVSIGVSGGAGDSNGIYVGYNANSNGTFTLGGGGISVGGGAGATLGLFVGYSGTGTFSQSGGSVSLSGLPGVNLYLGYNIGSAGTYVLSKNGSLTVGLNENEYIGYDGAGTLQQSGGVNIAQEAFGGLYVGFSGPGNYQLSGGTLSAFDETIGAGGTGTFNQTGGTNTVYNLAIGSLGQGSYLLSGTGSLNVTNGASVGSNTSTQGTGTLTVGGGSMSAGNGLTVYSGSTLTQTGGTLGPSVTISSGATYNMAGGTMNGAVIANSGGSFNFNGGTLNLSRAVINTGSTVFVGDGSTPATLNLLGGSNVYEFAEGLSISTAATLTGGGSITSIGLGAAPVAVYGTVVPLATQKSIAVNGSFTLEPSATVSIQSAGLAPGFGTITSTGNMALAGVLTISQDTLSEAATSPGQSLIILSTTGGTLTGGFAYVTSGQRLTTTDGLGSFIVTVNDGLDGNVVLSGFELSDVDYWKDGVAAGNWSNGNNWSATASSGTDNSGPPDAAANVYITHTDALARTTTLDVNAEIQTLQIGNTGGGTDTLSQAGAYNLAMNSEQVGIGSGGVGIHNQSAGTNTYSNALIVGASQNSNGTYNLSGSGIISVATTASGALGMCVGESGSGTFNQSSGSVTVGGTSNANLYLGYNTTSAGTYVLGGTGSLSVNGSVYVGGSSNGAGGVGTLTINGGSMTVSNGLNVYAGSNVTQTGGTVTVGNLAVYSQGAYTLNGGTLNAVSAGVSTASSYTVGNGLIPATLNMVPGPSYQEFTFTNGLKISPLTTLSGAGIIDDNNGFTEQVNVYGTIAPAVQRSIVVEGSLTLETSSTSLIQRAGSVSAFGGVESIGNMTLAGVLAVYEDAANEARTTSSQSFIILETNGGVLSGTFSNIASGQTLTTTDGTASFLVTINEGTDGDVVLSDFQMVPEPGAVSLLAIGALGLQRRRRRATKRSN